MVTQQDGTPSGSWHIAGIVEARTGLAGLALAADRPHEAVLHYTEGLDVLDGFAEGDADSGYAHRTLRCQRATALLRVGDHVGALKDCDEVLREKSAAQPDSLLLALLTRGQCLLAQGENDAAVRTTCG